MWQCSACVTVTQFGPCIFILSQLCLFFFKLNNIVPLRIETKFNFYINVTQIFLLKLLVLLNIFIKIKYI